MERQLSGSGDMAVNLAYGEQMDDDGNGVNTARYSWFTSKDASVDYSGMAIVPKQCMEHNGKWVIAYELFKHGHNNCQKHSMGYYLSDVGTFVQGHVLQNQYESYYNYGANKYGNPDSLEYANCKAFEQANDDGSIYYVKLGCSSAGGLKLLTYSDSSCTTEVSANLGIYNDAKVTFNQCNACTAQSMADDDGVRAEIYNNGYTDDFAPHDAKLCATLHNNDDGHMSCGWGCKRSIKKASAAARTSYGTSSGWNAFEKFFLFVWSFSAIGLVWVVLKQRRMMTREDAIVEEAAMNGIGLKKRHVFPIALGILFMILLGMFLAWKKLTWILLIGVNIGLFAQFVFLRRKAKKANAGTDAGYIKDAGLQIS